MSTVASCDLPTIGRSALERLRHPARHSITVCDVGGASVRGTARERNEDAWGVAGGRVFVAADGIGGRPAGHIAAQSAVQSILRRLDAPVTDWAELMHAVNTDVQEATEAAGHRRAGCVAVALRCSDDRVALVNLGDARAYRLRNGTIEPLTRDHCVAEHLAEMGLRRGETGLPRRELEAVTGYFGDHSAWVGFVVHELNVYDGDRIVLCTDGVHGFTSRATWLHVMSVAGAGDAAQFLVDRAVIAGARDDATALVVDLVSRSER